MLREATCRIDGSCLRVGGVLDGRTYDQLRGGLDRLLAIDSPVATVDLTGLTSVLLEN